MQLSRLAVHSLLGHQDKTSPLSLLDSNLLEFTLRSVYGWACTLHTAGHVHKASSTGYDVATVDHSCWSLGTPAFACPSGSVATCTSDCSPTDSCIVFVVDAASASSASTQSTVAPVAACIAAIDVA